MEIQIPDPIEYKISRPCPECGIDDVKIIPNIDGSGLLCKQKHKKDCKSLPIEWDTM